KQDEEPQPGLKATLRGELAEGVMQRVWEQLKGGFNLHNEPQESIARIVASAVEGALDEHYPPSEDPYRVRFRELERNRLAQLAREWLNVERKRSEGFRVIGHQVKVSCELAGFEVRGRIDRLDEIDGGFVVIDYKAGSAKNYTPSQWKSDRPHKPQLPLYAVALRREGREVNAVAFGILSAGECKFSGVAERRDILGMKSDTLKPNCDDGESTLSERVGTWERRISRLASDFLAGSASVDPRVMPGHSRCTCDHCHLHSACRIAEAMPVVADEEDSDE
ncbi:MAG TPA: PD-(D/E)XK nuclease family protein, partial [Clostridia bacterium]|nr:PD-(D/E)XK nuclease family protein [Clostridia bacterium]